MPSKPNASRSRLTRNRSYEKCSSVATFVNSTNAGGAHAGLRAVENPHLAAGLARRRMRGRHRLEERSARTSAPAAAAPRPRDRRPRAVAASARRSAPTGGRSGAYSRNFSWNRSLSSKSSTHSCPCPCTRSHLLTAMTMPQPARFGFAGDRAFAIAGALDGIDDEHGDVGARHRALGEDDADRFDLPAAATRPGRRMPAVSTMRNCRLCHCSTHVHRVARRAGHLAHHHPLFAQQPIDERRLADVRPADDGDGGLVLRLDLRRRRPTSGSRAAISSSSSETPSPCSADISDRPARSPADRTRARARARACRPSC